MMDFAFPSPEFDEAVADVCHGTASDDQVLALNKLLLRDQAACDEYILRIEMHSRLASAPDLFVTGLDQGYISSAGRPFLVTDSVVPSRSAFGVRNRKLRWPLAAAICFTLLAAGTWGLQAWRSGEHVGATSSAVAMLDRVVDAKWNSDGEVPGLEAPLEPRLLSLKSGLAQIVFYSGARVVLEGPADFEIISPSEAYCQNGRLTVNVPAQARGFTVQTPHGTVTDLGTEFGLAVTARATEFHVFKGSVQFESVGNTESRDFKEGTGAIIQRSAPTQFIKAKHEGFASLSDLRDKSAASAASRYEQWRLASDKLNLDSSLLVHFDFEYSDSTEWKLRNASSRNADPLSATIVGCQWNEGRWPSKAALEFHSVNDRVRLNVPGEHDSLTLSTWVRVQGLDRKFNSLFMCEGFESQTIHWLIRNDGVLGLTVIGRKPGDFQIIASPPVVTLDQFGMWLHLAVVLDGKRNRVVHYVNGESVHQRSLHIRPPFRIGVAELGNWNANGFRGHDSLLIRNFSGAMDEFCLYGRALNDDEIRSQFRDGTPHPHNRH